MKDLQNELQALIKPWQDMPGVAVCLVSADQPPIFAVSGYASLEYQLPIDLNTRFNLASVSKQFTGFAIRLLEKRGLLSTEDPIRKYLPEMSQTYQAVKVYHLLHHTSGLRCMYNLQAYAGFRRDDIHSREQLLALTNRQSQLNFPPGERYVYNNTGYVLLAEIVERLTGHNFRRFLDMELFEPLGMRSTFLGSDIREVVPGVAGHYNMSEEGVFSKAMENVSVGGSTNIMTSITDFSHWLGNFVNPTLEPDVVRGMDLTHPFNSGVMNMYACGIELSERAGHTIWAHSGGAGGYRSDMIFVPDARVAVGVLSNNGATDPVTLGYKILGLALPELAPKGLQFAGAQTAEISEAERKDLVGSYRMPDGLLATVEIAEDSLFIHTPFYPFRLPLLKVGDKRYKIDLLGAEMEAECDAQGKVQAFSSSTPLGPMRSVKLPPIEITPEGLAEYAGRYWSSELLNMWELSVSEGSLSMFHPHFPQITFFPVLQDEFSSRTENFDKLKFIRSTDGQITAFELSGDRAFNVRFNRVKEIICQ